MQCPDISTGRGPVPSLFSGLIPFSTEGPPHTLNYQFKSIIFALWHWSQEETKHQIISAF